MTDNTLNTTLSTPDQPPEKPACMQGQVFGYALMPSFNISSKVYTGNPYNISWKFTNNVKKSPDFINIKLQMLDPKIQVDWANVIGENIPNEPSWWIWTPKSSLDGNYKIRIVPNGKETFIRPIDMLTKKQPCFEDGEAIPSVSSTFRLINPKESIDSSGSYSSQFGPSTGSALGPAGPTVMLWFLVLAIVWNKMCGLL